MKKRHTEEYRCLCCFNSELLCGWYKPRPLYVKLIIFFNILQCFFWFLYFSIVFMTKKYFLETNLTYFIALFNPFLLDNEESDLNLATIRNLTILSIPQVISLIYTTHLGIQALTTSLSLRPTELYYRACFTTFIFQALIKIVMIAGVWGQENKVVFVGRYVGEIFIDVYVLLPVIKRYLDYEREQVYERELEEEAEMIVDGIIEKQASGASMRGTNK